MATTATVPTNHQPTRTPARWGGVIALMLAIFVLVTSEFLPASLLPAMANDFGVTEGTAGQVVTATALVGMLAGPGMAPLFPRMDRKRLLVGLLAMAVLANLITAISPMFALVVIARLALGAAIAGAWAMALAIASQLVEARHLGRAMMVVNIGVSAATVAAVPIGALISSLAGWRTVFVAITVATLVVLAVFIVLVPAIPATPGSGLSPLLEVLRSRVMIVGCLGLALLVAGHFGSYTFIRTAAESVPSITPAAIALLLAAYGIGGILGNVLIGLIVDRHLALAMALVPLIIGTAIIAFAFSTGSLVLVFIAAAFWGIGFGGNPTMSQTWFSRAEPDRIEAAGGLFVFTFQFAIAVGAAVGGTLLDATSIHSLFVAGGIAVLTGGAILFSTRHKLSRSASIR